MESRGTKIVIEKLSFCMIISLKKFQIGIKQHKITFDVTTSVRIEIKNSQNIKYEIRQYCTLCKLRET